jgi:hypothetical protein
MRRGIMTHPAIPFATAVDRGAAPSGIPNASAPLAELVKVIEPIESTIGESDP